MREAMLCMIGLLFASFVQADINKGIHAETIVTVSIGNAEEPVVVIEITPVSLKTRASIPDQRKIVLDKNNTGSLKMRLDGPAYIKIMNVWKDSSIHYVLMPGTHFHIQFDKNRRDFFKAEGVGQKENEFHDLIIGESERRLKAIPQNDPVSYVSHWRQQIDTLFQLIKSASDDGLDATYASWDRGNVQSLFHAALRQQLTDYVTIRGMWPVNIGDYKKYTIRYTEEQLNDPSSFSATGDPELISQYYLFEVIMSYYEKNKDILPGLEQVYSRAIENAGKMNSPDIKKRMMEYLVPGVISRTNDTDFLKSLRTRLANEKNASYFLQVADAKLKLLAAAGKGQTAPFFSATDPAGNRFSYANYAGSFLLIDIWATWCIPCVHEIPYIEKLRRKYANAPVAFVSVSMDNRKDTWLQFIREEKAATGQYYSDPKAADGIRTIYQARYIPAFILIDPRGKIITPACYKPSDPAIEMLLDKLLQSETSK